MRMGSRGAATDIAYRFQGLSASRNAPGGEPNDDRTPDACKTRSAPMHCARRERDGSVGPLSLRAIDGLFLLPLPLAGGGGGGGSGGASRSESLPWNCPPPSPPPQAGEGTTSAQLGFAGLPFAFA